MKNYLSLLLLTFLGSSCYDDSDFNGNIKSSNDSVIQKPCEENEEINIKYNSLIDSLSNSFDFKNTFTDLKKSISIIEEIKVLQKESTCLIQQASRLEAVMRKCEEMKLSSEELLKVTNDNDLRERVEFYNQMIELLDE